MEERKEVEYPFSNLQNDIQIDKSYNEGIEQKLEELGKINN